MRKCGTRLKSLAHTKTPPVGGVFTGAPQTIRTSGLFLRREALYPAELGVRDGAYRIVFAPLGQSSFDPFFADSSAFYPLCVA